MTGHCRNDTRSLKIASLTSIPISPLLIPQMEGKTEANSFVSSNKLHFSTPLFLSSSSVFSSWKLHLQLHWSIRPDVGESWGLNGFNNLLNGYTVASGNLDIWDPMAQVFSYHGVTHSCWINLMLSFSYRIIFKETEGAVKCFYQMSSQSKLDQPLPVTGEG